MLKKGKDGGEEGKKEKIYKFQSTGILEVSNTFHRLILPFNPLAAF